MVRIRRARVADRPGILVAHTGAIRVTCRTHYAADEIEAWAGRLTAASYDDPIARRDVLVAEADGRVLGFGELDVEAAEVRAVYVHPDAGRRGVGRLLLSALETIARLRGIAELHLDASLNAIDFYASAGWRRIGDGRRTFPGGRDIACVLMSKALQAVRVALRPETAADAEAIDAVVRAAFERAGEAAIVERLRRDGALVLSLVACVDGVVVGHVALSPVVIAGAAGRALGLGPLAVVPALQRCAIGARLVEEALASARASGAGAVVVLGDPAYYTRFGFVAAARHRLHFPAAPDDAFMAAEMVPGALAEACGVVRYHDAFGD
jgi:putative acetyltransferase